MKKLFLISAFCLSIVTAQASTYSDFAAEQYAQNCNKEKTRIILKKEHIEEYAQEIGNKFIPYIAYGYGDLKTPKCRKQRITYICLLDNDLNPLWSYVFRYK